MFDLINVVTLCWAQLVRGWVIVLEWVNHLGAEPGTEAYLAWAHPLWQAGMSTRHKLESKQAYSVIHQPVSIVSQCSLIPGWRAGLQRSAPMYGKW